MSKILSQDPIFCENIKQLEDLKISHRKNQKIEFKCEKCGEVHLKNLYSTNELLCMRCKFEITTKKKQDIKFEIKIKTIDEEAFRKSSAHIITGSKNEKRIEFDCLKCHKRVNYLFKNFKNVFTCRECKCEETSWKNWGCRSPNQSLSVKEKSKQTCLEKYGVENPFKSEIIKSKIKATNLSKYGTYISSQNVSVKEKAKKTIQNRTAEEKRLILQKRINTNLEKYGVECSLQNEEVREKAKKTNLDRYGYENPQKSEILKEKAKQTCLERYGVENYSKTAEAKDKSKQTCLEKYGVEYPMQSQIVKNKLIETCLEKYGCENVFQSDDVKEKIKQTCLDRYGSTCYTKTKEYLAKSQNTKLEKYGDVHYVNVTKISKTKLEKYGDPGFNNFNKTKRTNLEKYGVEYPSQSDAIKEKTKQTCLERYGVESYAQTKEARQKASRRWRIYFDTYLKEIRQKASRKYKYNEIFFDSSWELAYFIYLVDHNIDFKYQCDPIEYFDDDGKKHFWIPDFEVDGRYVEIKGDHFFTESGQFINPFNRSLDEDKHNLKKYECMVKNNTIILKSGDMQPILEYVFSIYGKPFLKECREPIKKNYQKMKK